MKHEINSTGQWNGTCICGHLHNEHKKLVAFNPNWSAGECDVCKICKHFHHQINHSKTINETSDKAFVDMGEKLKKIIRIRKDPLRSTKEVFDAIDNIDGCTCCGWDNARYVHEPFCNLAKKSPDYFDGNAL